MMYKDSPNTKLVLDYFERKYCKEIANTGLLKVLSILSAKWVDTLPKFNVFNVAPTRHFKSRTTKEAMSIVPKRFYVETGSDFTIFFLIKMHNMKKLKNKCVLVNDGTVLFSTKSKRAKDRLIGGLAELTSDGDYIYGERLKSESILNCPISVVMNMTLESYNQNEKNLLGSTFLERFITVFHTVPAKKMKTFMPDVENRKKITIEELPKTLFKKTQKKGIFNPKNNEISEISEDFSIASFKSMNGTYDQLTALAKVHARFNERDEVTKDDLVFIKSLKENISTAGNRPKIIEMLKKGYSVKDICEKLEKDYEKYKPFIYRIKKKAVERGLI